MVDKKEIAKILKPYNADLKRHMAALGEEYQERLKGVAELVVANSKKLDSHSKILDSHTEMIGQIMEKMEIIKMDVEFIKGALKKKVDYDEFMALAKRLSLVEAKLYR